MDFFLLPERVLDTPSENAMKTLIASMVFALASIISVHGAEVPRTNAPPGAAQAMKKPQGMPFYGKVSAFDKQSITLDGKEKKRMFYLTPTTRIHRDKAAARLEEVVVGQWVGGFVRPDTDGRPTVINLNLAVEQRGSPVKTATNAAPPKAGPSK